MDAPVDGRITPLPSNEFYQSPFDGRWVDVAETLLKALEKDESC